MRELAGTRVEDGFLRSLWLQRLPAQIQAILSSDDSDVPRLLIMADRIHEVLDVRSAVRAVSNLPPPRPASYVVPIPANATDNSCTSDFQRLCTQVNWVNNLLLCLVATTTINDLGRLIAEASPGLDPNPDEASAGIIFGLVKRPKSAPSPALTDRKTNRAVATGD